MKSEQKFPRELLSCPIAERVRYFGLMEPINHTHFKTALAQTLTAVSSETGPKVILVAGPTGAGKTTLASKIYRKILEQHQERMQRELDFVPVLYGNAIAPNGTSFSWKDFYIRLLERAIEPLIDRKLLLPKQQSFIPPAGRLSPYEANVPDALRRSVEECLRRRKTKLLIIDEAHHLLMVSNEKRLEFQFEAIKSLANETGVTILLIGTYKLLDIRDQSGQLMRRSEIIHFPRYDSRIKSDLLDFIGVLNSFSEHLPLLKKPLLSEHAENFYLKTGGGIGILKDWLARAYERYLISPSGDFDWNFIEPFAMPNKALKTIITEALMGEEKLMDIPISDLAQLLEAGLPRLEDNPTSLRSEARRKHRIGQPVGKRKPVRDPIGGAYV